MGKTIEPGLVSDEFKSRLTEFKEANWGNFWHLRSNKSKKASGK